MLAIAAMPDGQDAPGATAPTIPSRDHTTGKYQTVSMNHGFAVDADSFPDGVEETFCCSRLQLRYRLPAGRCFRCSTTGSLARPAGSALHGSAAFVNLIRQKKASWRWPMVESFPSSSSLGRFDLAPTYAYCQARPVLR